MYEWHTVGSQADIEKLRFYFNDFHDAYIKSVSFKNDIVSNGMLTVARASDLHVVLLVTSVKELPVVELRFSRVHTYHFGVPYADMTGIYLEADDGGVIWANDGSFDPDNIGSFSLRNKYGALSYVAAETLDWRLVDLPGTRLKQLTGYRIFSYTEEIDELL